MHDDDGLRVPVPGCGPQPQQVLTIEIKVGLATTPTDVILAVSDSLAAYGRENNGTLTPFAQQPGYPSGFIRDTAGHAVGDWKIR